MKLQRLCGSVCDVCVFVVCVCVCVCVCRGYDRKYVLGPCQRKGLDVGENLTSQVHELKVHASPMLENVWYCPFAPPIVMVVGVRRAASKGMAAPVICMA